MVKVPTVLILGAGASAHVGYPLGSSLIAELCRWEEFGPDKDRRLLSRWQASQIKDFVNRVGRSGHYSIDAFLEQNPEHTDLGRFMIARLLKRRETLGSLFPPGNSGWYQYLLNKIIEDDRRAERIGENALTIITFNYDRSLECYLHEAIQARCQLSADEAAERLKSLPIIHPHGMLGAYPQIRYFHLLSFNDDFAELDEIASGIKIIHELQDSDARFCAPEFETANERLRNAERILFLGFGFHTDNIRRFNFFTPKALREKEVIGTVHGIGSADMEDLLERLAGFGIRREMLKSADCNGFFSYVTRLR